MKKVLLSFTVLICFLTIANRSMAQQAQSGDSYNAAVGLKFGAYEDGISFKWFASPSVSYEGLLGFRNHGVVVTGLYELNMEAFNVPELKFYYGFGAHIGAEGRGYYDRVFGGTAQYYSNSHLLLGADGVVGLEYLIPKSPIAVSLDLDPRIELASGPFFDIGPGLGVKYTF
ncbi:MAG: hypothetical protein ACTHNW_13250 [Mucilaginibacter sp.]